MNAPSMRLGSGPLRGWRVLGVATEQDEVSARSWFLSAILRSAADDLRGELEVLERVVDGRTVAEHVARGVLERLAELRAELGGPPAPHQLAERDGYTLLYETIVADINAAEASLGPVQAEDTGDEIRAEWPTGELLVFRRHGACDLFWKDCTSEALDEEARAIEDADALRAQEAPEGPSGTTLDAQVEAPVVGSWCGSCATTHLAAGSCPLEPPQTIDGPGRPDLGLAPSKPLASLYGPVGARPEPAPLEVPEGHDPARVDAALAVGQLADGRRRELGVLPTLAELAKSSTQATLAGNREGLATFWEQLAPLPTTLAVPGLCSACSTPCQGILSHHRPGDGVSRVPVFGHAGCIAQGIARLTRGGSGAGPFGDMTMMRAELVAGGLTLDGGEVWLELQALVLDLRRRHAVREIDWTAASRHVAKRGRKDPCVLCGAGFVKDAVYLNWKGKLAHEGCAAIVPDEKSAARAEEPAPVEEPEQAVGT